MSSARRRGDPLEGEVEESLEKGLKTRVPNTATDITSIKFAVLLATTATVQ